MVLTQQEADELILLEKRFLDNAVLELSQAEGMDYSRDLASLDNRERFSLDVRRSRRQRAYLRYQNRARQCVVLARLEIDGPRHQNPPIGEEVFGRWISGTHLHLYREGFEDKIAHELSEVPGFSFTQPVELTRTFSEFLDFCHVVERPVVQLTL